MLHGVVPRRPEPPARFDFGIAPRPAVRDELLDTQLQVKPELGVDVTLGPFGPSDGEPEEAANPRTQHADHRVVAC